MATVNHPTCKPGMMIPHQGEFLEFSSGMAQAPNSFLSGLLPMANYPICKTEMNIYLMRNGPICPVLETRGATPLKRMNRKLLNVEKAQIYKASNLPA